VFLFDDELVAVRFRMVATVLEAGGPVFEFTAMRRQWAAGLAEKNHMDVIEV